MVVETLPRTEEPKLKSAIGLRNGGEDHEGKRGKYHVKSHIHPFHLRSSFFLGVGGAHSTTQCPGNEIRAKPKIMFYRQLLARWEGTEIQFNVALHSPIVLDICFIELFNLRE